MKIVDLYRKKGFPYITCALTALCLIATTAIFFYPTLLNDLAFQTRPAHVWQYLTGLFAHVPNPEPWMAFVHLGMNLLCLVPFGALLEKRYGWKAMLLVFLAVLAAANVAFQLVSLGKNDATAAGISPVCYAYAAMTVGLLLPMRREMGRAFWKQPLAWYFALETLGMLSLLQPARGISSLAIHVSGAAVGAVAAWRLRKR